LVDRAFSNGAIADYLDTCFLTIKVDRNDRPSWAFMRPRMPIVSPPPPLLQDSSPYPRATSDPAKDQATVGLGISPQPDAPQEAHGVRNHGHIRGQLEFNPLGLTAANVEVIIIKQMAEGGDRLF
jgi:hypothetical protein